MSTRAHHRRQRRRELAALDGKPVPEEYRAFLLEVDEAAAAHGIVDFVCIGRSRYGVHITQSENSADSYRHMIECLMDYGVARYPDLFYCTTCKLDVEDCICDGLDESS